MTTPKPPVLLGRPLCRAVAAATGLDRITHASISATHDDVTMVTVTFMANEAQAKEISAHLLASVEPK